MKNKFYCLLNQLILTDIKRWYLKSTLTVFYVTFIGISTLYTGNSHATETIVLLRHAEKPNEGLGQLSCQGLNRSLALPEVLLKNFGKPDAIFAPNPSIKKMDHGVKYPYIRPLATIEPTAIRVGLPVNIEWGFDDIESLKQALMDSSLKNSTVFVAWEHHLLDEIAKRILSNLHASPEIVPTWRSDDFDSIYVITISEDSSGNRTAVFNIVKEGLNKQSTTCS
jgi:hypothetical protein